ncbi:MAG TPA: hypothetical protein VL463_06845 [Kofleriaceae bacterium]|nr:hypothetical protein [Kofleriaceae bacterium]
MRRLLFAVGVLLAAAPAYANVRFPTTQTISFRKGTTSDLVLGSTPGLLLSKDDGKHFYWVCDNAIFGDNSDLYDPDYKIAADGTIYANTPAGVRISRDGGCTFDIAQVENITPQKWVDAIALGPNDEVWIGQTEGGKPNDVFLSTDGGQHWASKGLLSPTTWWKSIRVAASNPQRVYLSGYEVTQVAPDGGTAGPRARVLRTDDQGGKWTELPTTDITLSTSSPMVFVMAVSPTDPDLLFLISQAASPPMGDKLYRSTDGGMTWSFMLDSKSPIRAVVFLQDGSVVAASQMGSWQAPTATGTFAELAGQPQLECLGQREDGAIFGCGANWDPDFLALGESGPSPVGPWTKVFRFSEMAGPLSCPAGTVQHDVCELQLWPSVKEQFGIAEVDGAPMPDAQVPPMKKPTGCCDSSAGGLETFVIVVIAVGIGGLLFRRGKKKKKACCQ